MGIGQMLVKLKAKQAAELAKRDAPYNDMLARDAAAEGTYNTGFTTAMGQAGGIADQLAGYETDPSIADFDAMSAMNQYASGAWGQAQEGMKRTLADVRGASVGAGRLDTGFLDEDQGDVVRSVMADYGNNVNMQAMNAAGMTLGARQFAASQKLGALTSAGGMRSDAARTYAGRAEAATDRRSNAILEERRAREAREAEARARKAASGNVFGKIAGSVIGMGVGAFTGGLGGAAAGAVAKRLF